MKNVTLVICSILLYGLIGQMIETDANLITKKAVINCVRGTGMKWRQLKEIADLEVTPDGRIELIKAKDNFRDYGCFLACLWQKNNTNALSDPVINMDIATEDMQRVYGNDSDVGLAINKAMTTCLEIVGEEEDGCQMVLDIKFCVFETMLKSS